MVDATEIDFIPPTEGDSQDELNEILEEICSHLIDNQVELDPEIAQALRENLWELYA